MKGALLLVALAALLSAQASVERHPLLAQLENGKIYVPWFQALPQNLPKDLVFYPVLLRDGQLARDHTPLRGVFLQSSTNIDATDFEIDRGFQTRTGLVYSSGSTAVGFVRGFVLPAGQTLRFDSFNSRFEAADRSAAYTLLTLTSAEGLHYVLQILEGGKCAAFLDYYLYAGYDTQPDPDSKFESAFCGRKIDPRELKE